MLDAIAAEIETALGAVESLDEDRILRHFVNAVTSALRTNFYQSGDGGQPKATIAIKFDSRKIDGLPLPKPLYEIFVYSPRLEAVHMRFGKVARGGIRWSDRPQDFRTEVLGLVKAQQVKNAVIVPVGAKGGFVPKRMPAGGFPHRNTGPGESPAGQERRDRAGGRQGRLFSQADAGKSHPRTVHGNRHRGLQDLHQCAPGCHRQSGQKR